MKNILVLLLVFMSFNLSAQTTDKQSDIALNNLLRWSLMLNESITMFSHYNKKGWRWFIYFIITLVITIRD